MGILDTTASTWTAAQLLTDVRQKARIPAGSLDYGDTVLLEEASRALWSFAGWAMSKAADGRLLSIMQRASSSSYNSFYAQGREVELPPDAVGDTFDSVFWVDSSGIESRLDLIPVADQPTYDAPTATGTPWGYSVIDGRLRMYPAPQSAGTVRFQYQRRHPLLVDATTSSRAVTATTISAGQIQVSHGGAQLLSSGDLFDIINPLSPYRFELTNAVCTGGTPASGIIISTTYTASTVGNTAGAGSFFTNMTLVKSGTTPYVHLPLEFRQCLTQKIAAQILGDIGDMAGAQALEQKAEIELGRVVELLNPRSQTSRVKVVNPYSHLRTRRWSRWGG